MAAKKQMGFSYSRWGAFKKCKRNFKYQYVDKLPKTETYAATQGNQAHALAESYVKGLINGIPKVLLKFKDEFNFLRGEYKKGYVTLEDMLKFDKNWKQQDGWKDYWVCGALDAYVKSPDVELIVDYKTGRVYEESHEEQGSLYACMKGVGKKVDVEFWYLGKDKVLSWQYTAKEIKLLKKKWEKNYKEMISEGKYNPSPSCLCQYCSYSRSTGGPCEEG